MNHGLYQTIVLLTHVQDGVLKLFANGGDDYRLYCNDDARGYSMSEIAECINNLTTNVTVYIINPDSKPYSGY